MRLHDVPCRKLNNRKLSVSGNKPQPEAAITHASHVQRRPVIAVTSRAEKGDTGQAHFTPLRLQGTTLPIHVAPK